jgi:hypothetical protein
LRGDVLDARDGIAHRPAAFLVAAQPGEQAALIMAALLDEMRRELVRRHDLARRDARRARGEVGIEEIGGRGGLDAARRLHRFVFGEELERHRRRAVGELVQEDAQLAARAVDGRERRVALGSGQLLEPRQLPLDLVGERDHGVEPDHLDRAGGLVDVRARVLERRVVVRVLRVHGERLEAARERLVDLALHPGQGSEIEIGCGIHRHAVLVRSNPKASSKIRAASAHARRPRVACYTLKPATEERSSAASLVSCPIDTFVCLVPSVVSSVILRMPCMPRVTSVTDVDCICVCAEMRPISSASSRDTRWISVSA